MCRCDLRCHEGSRSRQPSVAEVWKIDKRVTLMVRNAVEEEKCSCIIEAGLLTSSIKDKEAIKLQNSNQILAVELSNLDHFLLRAVYKLRPLLLSTLIAISRQQSSSGMRFSDDQGFHRCSTSSPEALTFHLHRHQTPISK